MDVSTLAQAAVLQNAGQNRQEMNVALTKQAIESQTQAAVGMMQQVADQAKAAAAEARGGVDIKV